MGYAASVVEESLKQQKFDDCYASYLLLGRRNTDVSLLSREQCAEVCVSFCFSWTARAAGAAAPSPSEPWRPGLAEEETASRPPRRHTPRAGPADTAGCRGPSAPPAGTSPGGAVRVGTRPQSVWAVRGRGREGKVGAQELLVVFLVLLSFLINCPQTFFGCILTY